MSAAIADLPLVASGKVREIYDLGDRLLMVASDRISTYDVVHPNPIPDKGKVLTGLSAFWFAKTGHIVANHYVSATEGVPDEVRGRAMVVRKLEMLPVECVVRGYLTGSGWKDYKKTGAVSGHRLPPGLLECAKLTPALYTPSMREALRADFHRIPELLALGPPEQPQVSEPAPDLEDLAGYDDEDEQPELGEPEPAAQLGLF